MFPPSRVALTLAAFFLLPAVTQAADQSSVRKFLDTHCVSCHAGKDKQGGLDLEKLPTDFRAPGAFESWVKVHDRIRSSEMPPKAKKKRADKAEVDAVLKELGAGLVSADRSRSNRDRAEFRRLNRSEYENTLRDLFGIPGLRVKQLLPEDGKAFGYDKSAAGLELSYVQLSKYLEAADAALDAAIAPHAARPPVCKMHIPGGGAVKGGNAVRGLTVFLKDFQYDSSVMPILERTKNGNKDPEAKKLIQYLSKHPYPGTVGMFRTEIGVEFKPRFPFQPVYPGRYRLRMSVWSFLWDKGQVKANSRPEVASLIVDGRTLAYFDAPSLKPTVKEMVVWLNATKSQQGTIQFSTASLQGGDHEPGHIIMGNLTKAVHSGIAVDWLEIEGPLLDQWPPVSHRRLFGDLSFTPLAEAPKPKGGKKQPVEHDAHVPKRPPQTAYNALVRGTHKPYVVSLSGYSKHIEFSTVTSNAPVADARRLLADFLPRAFRRPVASEEVQRYVGLVQSRLADGDMFEVAMRTAYKAALCSPNFLFLKETAGKLDDWALASRLSYFLWNSMPDDALFGLAANNRLHEPAVLREQVERMLKDKKSERFINDFTDQWLDLAEIDDTTPDRKLYPEFRRILRDAMLGETRAFFHELVEKDLSATNVVHSDFAMLNQRLASHYRISGVIGSDIRRVQLAAGCCRGGLLTQASVLKVTANGTVTSPVRRGAWVLRKIVGRPPDQQPKDVPAIEPDVRGTTTVREMLAAHRKHSCASCHKKIDPPGFALESFDVIGTLQTRYRILRDEFDTPIRSVTGQTVRYTWGAHVDGSGELADGRSFQDISDFKKLLLADPRALARNLVEQLVIYGTGAPVRVADWEAVDQVLDRTADRRHGIRSLIHEIVQSPLFVSK